MGDNMRRKIMNDLIKWKNNESRKPLLIVGARQVGKTFIMKQFGNENFSEVIYLNFEIDSNLKAHFETNLIPKEIIKGLEIYFNKTINILETLLIFDEIQVCPKAITSLKYFFEDESNFNIIGAGSTLGILLQKSGFSFPVGKVDMISMYPMDFEEFLMAQDRDNAIQRIKDSISSCKPINEALHNQFISIYREYLYVGGFPEMVNNYINSDSIIDINKNILKMINEGYQVDMIKYASPNESMKIKKVYNSILSQLTKENKKFQYAKVEKGKKARYFESSVEWLLAADIVSKGILIENAKSPIKANYLNNFFKLYYLDTGLVCNMINIEPNKILNKSEDFTYKGAITEIYIASQLRSAGFDLQYWKKNTSELDFIIEKNGDVYPIEVKSGNNTKSKSLNVYVERYKPKFSIRISAKNIGCVNNIKSVPLYAVFALGNLFN